MIPIRDMSRSRKPAVARNFLILANIVVFVYSLTLSPYQTEAFIKRYGFLASKFAADPFFQAYSLISYQFLHGNLWHILGNMWYLWIFGKNVEARMGAFAFLGFYLFAGLISCMAQSVAFPYSSVPLVGASGSIAGILGIYLAFFPRARIIAWVPFGFFGWATEIRAFFFLAFWFLYQFVLGYTTYDAYTWAGGVAWWAHVGGFVLGLLFGLSIK